MPPQEAERAASELAALRTELDAARAASKAADSKVRVLVCPSDAVGRLGRPGALQGAPAWRELKKVLPGC